MSVKKKLISGGGAVASTPTQSDGELNYNITTSVMLEEDDVIDVGFTLEGTSTEVQNISGSLPNSGSFQVGAWVSGNNFAFGGTNSQSPLSYTLDGVSFSNSTYVGGGTIGVLNYRSIAAAPNGVVMVIGGGSCYKSTDGGQTYASSPVVSGNLFAVGTDGSGNWMAVGSSNAAYYSSDDGANWTSLSTDSGVTSKDSVAYGNGAWIIGGADGANQTCFEKSTNNGTSWTTTQTGNYDETVRSLATNDDDVWFACSTLYYYWSNDNGATWTRAYYTSGYPSRNIAYNNNRFWISVRYNGVLHLREISAGSDDGSWTSYKDLLLEQPTGSPDQNCVVANDNYLIYGQSALFKRSITSVAAGNASHAMFQIKNVNANGNDYIFDTVRGNPYYFDIGSGQQFSNSGVVDFRPEGLQWGASFNRGTNTNQRDRIYAWRVQEGFFDIVTWTGDGSTNRQIAHNLNAPMGMMWVYRKDAHYDQPLWHRKLVGGLAGVSNGNININNSDTITNSDYPWGSNNDTFTDTHFYVGSSNSNTQNTVNATGGEYIAYIWAHNPTNGISCDWWTGTGIAGWNIGNKVDFGWPASYVFHRQPQSSVQGATWDLETGGGINGLINPLYQPVSSAGYRDATLIPDPEGVSRIGNSTRVNSNGNESIYLAVKKQMPTITSSDDFFGIPTYQGNGDVARELIGRFLAGDKSNLTANTRLFYSRDTRQGSGVWTDRYFDYGHLYPDTSTFYNSGTHIVTNGLGTNDVRIDNATRTNSTNGYAYHMYTIKNAALTYESLTYIGENDGSGNYSRAVPHNLGTAPEMIFMARMGGGAPNQTIKVYHKDAGITKSLTFNSTPVTVSNYFTQAPDASNIYFGSSNDVSYSVGAGTTHWLAMMATNEGITKVGSYTGDGTSQKDIDCSFTSGCKALMIYNATLGNWWHTNNQMSNHGQGGIVVRNLDSSVSLQNNNYIELSSYNSGFRVIGNSEINDFNASGTEFYFFAVAA